MGRFSVRRFFFIVTIIAISGGVFSYCKIKFSSPNVVLITIDALRPDHLGCYGYKRATSPNIDKLAQDGVLFTQAISQTSWTAASLMSLLTSTYPSTHKVDDWGLVLDQSLVTLAETLKRKNYVTAWGGGGNWIYKEIPSSGRGFDYFFDAPEVEGLIEQILEWMVKFKNKKFFIWVHFFDFPHTPYLPPAPYNELFISAEAGKKLPIGKGAGGKGFIPDFAVVNHITDIEYYISQYDGEIAYIDEQLGRILDRLKTLNLDKNTLVIISSDHGESLGEHNYYFQHGYYLYDQLLKVPLIIKGPKIPRGGVIDQQVQMIDIIPTILSFLKIKTDTEVEGISLLPVILGRENKQIYAFSEVSNGLNLKSIRTDGWKLIYNLTDDEYELYDLKNDAEETVNLAGIEKKQFEYLKVILEEWMNRPRPTVTPLKEPLDEQTKDRLRSLGYLQ